MGQLKAAKSEGSSSLPRVSLHIQLGVLIVKKNQASHSLPLLPPKKTTNKTAPTLGTWRRGSFTKSTTWRIIPRSQVGTTLLSPRALLVHGDQPLTSTWDDPPSRVQIPSNPKSRGSKPWWLSWNLHFTACCLLEDVLFWGLWQLLASCNHVWRWGCWQFMRFLHKTFASKQ